MNKHILKKHLIKIRHGTWLNIGLGIFNNIFIGKNIQIGVNSLIINNIFEEGIYYGNPATLHRKGGII